MRRNRTYLVFVFLALLAVVLLLARNVRADDRSAFSAAPTSGKALPRMIPSVEFGYFVSVFDGDEFAILPADVFLPGRDVRRRVGSPLSPSELSELGEFLSTGRAVAGTIVRGYAARFAVPGRPDRATAYLPGLFATPSDARKALLVAYGETEADYR